MRILIVSDVSSRMRGGVPAETRELVNGLVGRGHVVALASDARLVGAEAAQHLSITIPITPDFVAELSRAMDDFQPEFVHVICMSSRGVLALAPLLRNRRWALTVHSVPPYERKLRHWHGVEWLHYAARALRYLPNSLTWRWVLRGNLVPRVIVHSDFVAAIVVGYGVAPSRVDHVALAFHEPRGIAAPEAGLRNVGEPWLVTVGGFAHTKGQHDVVKALPALLRRFPRLRYQLIGELRDESYLRWLRALATSLGVADHLLITPDLSDGEKGLALARADVYVQPSHEEGFCLSFAEAAARVPRLVGADTGAIAAMCRDDAGARLVPVRRPAAIADAVATLLDADLPAALMAERACRLAARFSYDDYLTAHVKIYSASACMNPGAR